MSLHVRCRPGEPTVETLVDDGADPGLVWLDDGLRPRRIAVEDWEDAPYTAPLIAALLQETLHPTEAPG